MPELPEVETTVRGIRPHILHRRIEETVVRNPHLRKPVRADLPALLHGENVCAVERRAKYIHITLQHAHLLIHLGMSGSLRILLPETFRLPEKHDHADFVFDDGTVLRYRDPRRFGLIEWLPENAAILPDAGKEPLDDTFNAAFLHQAFAAHNTAVKNVLMNAKIIAGIGNIYASEALFHAGIHPLRPACSLDLDECARLAAAVRTTLLEAVGMGGSTLRDFTRSDGTHGYFQQNHFVYARAGEPCRRCGTPVSQKNIAQRSSFFCTLCQPYR